LKARGGLRILGGTARGAILFSVPGYDVRPALARMRKSLFDILRPRIGGARVLDLFAGTGSLGLEALSRGAVRAVFVDSDPRSLEAVRRNLEKLRFVDRAEALPASAFEAVSRLGPADLAFVDPPYDFYRDRAVEMRRLVETVVSAVLAPEGLAVVEHRSGGGLGEVAGARTVDARRYGGTEVTFYARA
jgi:16S rRNA (guanine(966)-N(2))-methyltransferase RsmD